MKIKKYLVTTSGGTSQIAKYCGVTTQAVRNWANSTVPAKRVLDVCKATNHAVLPHEMRPDLYPIGLINLNSLSDSESISNEKQ